MRGYEACASLNVSFSSLGYGVIEVLLALVIKDILFIYLMSSSLFRGEYIGYTVESYILRSGLWS